MKKVYRITDTIFVCTNNVALSVKLKYNNLQYSFKTHLVDIIEYNMRREMLNKT